MWKFILAAFLAFMTLFFFATPFVFFLDPITLGILVVIGAFIIIAKGVLDPDVKKSETSNKSVEQKNVSIKTQDSKFHEENEEIKVSNTNLIENIPTKRQIIVDSNACYNYGKLTDIDGNVYDTIQIGNQVWMAENLRVSRYRNGDLIPNITNGIEWRDSQVGAWCYYDNIPFYDTEYGKLYNWYAVDDQRGLAPEGWHVPSDEEWQELIDYLGGKPVVFNKLIEAGKEYWIYNEGATNETLFTALPNGSRGNDSSFYRLGDLCDWWTSSEDKTNSLCAKNIYSHFFNRIDDIEIKTLGSYGVFKFNGNAVRCLRNIGIKPNTINDSNENEYIDEFGVKYNTAKTKLVKAPLDLKVYTILPTTKVICDEAFYNCLNLKTVHLPDNLIEIGSSTFQNCSNLKSINMPESLTSIGEAAFANCISIEKISIPNRVTILNERTFNSCKKLNSVNLSNSLNIIGKAAFANCESIEKLLIPKGVGVLGESAFNNCNKLSTVFLSYDRSIYYGYVFAFCVNLQEINIKAKKPAEISDIVFEGVDKTKCVLNVPIGSKELYEKSHGWGEFKTIKELLS